MFGLDSINPEWFVTIGLISIAMFVLTLLIVPIVIVRIPEDYFSDEQRHVSRWASFHPVLRYLLIALKNIAGFILLLMGILMLVLPGQGLLTIFFGIALMDFPGKYAVERRLVSYPKVLHSINWIRKKANKKPLLI
ncbi:PGPGW domain-containing protein [Leucothrix pacifica]|nr:PGPGW domain-containing protein [Leucothrix pacifica]